MSRLKPILKDILRQSLKIIKVIIKILILTIKMLILANRIFFRTLIKPFIMLNKRLHFSITFKISVVYTFIFSIILFILTTSTIGAYWFISAKPVIAKLSKNNEIVKEYAYKKDSIPYKFIADRARKQDLIIAIYDNNSKLLYITDKSFDYEQLKHNFLHNPYIDDEIIINKNSYSIRTYKVMVKEYGQIKILFAVFLIASIIAILFTICIASKATRKMLKPIQQMTNDVKAISIDALFTRLDVCDSKDELKDLAETFNNMLDRIQKSYEQQNQFVSDASHELRTPISVVQGYANMLDRWGKDNPEVLDEAISAIKTEAQSMKELIEKLLFLARADKNTQKINKEEFYSSELIYEIVKETRMIDETHKIINEMNVECKLNADRNLLKEAIRIFIENSIKYTKKDGEIKINSYIENKMLKISVEDTGIGIPEKDIPLIFNRFYRADESRTKEAGGTGLGLSIAKWIIDRHEGIIEVESKVNIGTKIVISIPCK